MSGGAKKLLHAAAGTAASGDPVYVEDVFSTDVYISDGNDRTITNNIDLSGEGGLVWIKFRDTGLGSGVHALFDTERGVNKYIRSDDSAAEATLTEGVEAFNNDGYDIGNYNSENGACNYATANYVGWTFRKQPGFFDIVKWTGTGANLTVPHNLGCVPGMIAIKNTSGVHEFNVYHVGTDSSNPETKALILNDTNAAETANLSKFQRTAPTATNFYVGSNADCNEDGETMIAYLFAGTGDSASQIFGDDGDEAIIKTGDFTCSGSDVAIDLGFEPQFLIVKSTASSSLGWYMYDNMRGIHVPTQKEMYLHANSSNSENKNNADQIQLTSTGFIAPNAWWNTELSAGRCIYIAIRRGPMKEPSAGTDVFKAVASDSAGAFQTGFPVDCYMNLAIATSNTLNYWSFRKLWHWTLMTEGTDASQGYDASGLEKGWGVNTYYSVYDEMTKVGKSFTNSSENYHAFCWRRYPKVFDIVQYEGAGAGNHTHNLKAVPEMILLSCISHPNRNVVYHKAMGNTKQLHLDEDIAETTGQFGDTTPTASVFTVSNNTQTGTSGRRFIAMLFASLDGICEVGSYTGTGNDLNVTGLGAAVRWVMIKRTDATGDWFVYDTTRGIATGNDPYVFLNERTATVTNTDYIDPHSSGFTITSSAPAALNANGGTYIYLAYA